MRNCVDVRTRTRMLSCMSTDTHESQRTTLYRASLEFDINKRGRTIEGLAIPWDTWTMVRDLTGPEYPEAHAPSNFDESLRRDPGSRPLFAIHDYAFHPGAEPIGVVQFTPSSTAMMYRATLSNTRKADEHLELIKDGAERAVSVGFRPLKTRRVPRERGLIGRYRVESKLRELSIAPTGFGQYEASKVLSVRSRPPRPPRRVVPTALDNLHALNERRRGAGHSQLPPEFIVMSSDERIAWMEEH